MLLFLFPLIFLASAQCNIYQCKPQKVEFEPDQCIFNFTATTYYLSLCPEDQYCPPITSPGNSSCEAIPNTPQQAWPGETCNVNITCAFGTCQNKFCQGKTVGTACTQTGECNPGLYCSTTTNKCATQITIGGNGCHNDYECVNNAGCNITGDGTGQCVGYLSVEVDDEIAQCANHYNLLCESTLCGTINGTNVCGSSVASASIIPMMCTSDGDCFSEGDPALGIGYGSSCQCSYGFQGIKYCGLFPGDPIASNYFELLKAWYSNANVTLCNSLRRDNPACVKSHWSTKHALEYTYFRLWYQMYSQIQDNDECVMQIYTSNFWNSKDEYDEYGNPDPDAEYNLSFSSSLVISGLLVLMF
ncbi:unnamed protein product [Blepharisma stoltei]|uniref:EGF-like domain-containing protein n=1 Tax=Blepharisma stoltei TaxID=1481888 RepID=A0AAU9JQP5_9CILI|nr:unnamed protein product [Blepharisma stoltei]